MFFKSRVAWKLPKIFMNDYWSYFGSILSLNSLKAEPLKSWLFGWIWVSYRFFPHSVTCVEKLGASHIDTKCRIFLEIKTCALENQNSYVQQSTRESDSKTWFERVSKPWGENWLSFGRGLLNMNGRKWIFISSLLSSGILTVVRSLAFLGWEARGPWVMADKVPSSDSVIIATFQHHRGSTAAAGWATASQGGKDPESLLS